MSLSSSKRALKGKLVILDKRCYECGHHKALATHGGRTKCANCGYKHDK